jgi:hypothetical protein
MAWDILIRGGTVIDGGNQRGERADVAIQGGRIARIGRDLPADADRLIDAGGLTVSPGRNDRDHRPLRLLGRAVPARQGPGAGRLPERRRAVAALPRDQFPRLPRHFSGGCG